MQRLNSLEIPKFDVGGLVGDLTQLGGEDGFRWRRLRPRRAIERRCKSLMRAAKR